MLEFYVDSLITIHFFNYHGGVIISDLMINGQIRDKEVRLIANDGEQLASHSLNLRSFPYIIFNFNV